MAPSVSAAAPATRRRSPVVVSGRWKHNSRSVPAAPRNASLHSSTTPSSSSAAAEDADAGAHSASRFGHRRASATTSSAPTIISAAASASSSPGVAARKLPTVTVRISGSESSPPPPSPRARTSILVSATQSVSARVDNFGPAILAVVSEGHRASRSVVSAFASAGASGSSFEPHRSPVRSAPPSVISSARRFAHWRNTVRTASSSMFAAAPTASLARFRVKSPTRCAARGMALHAPRVTSTSASSLSTGTTPCAAAVWPSRLGRSAPGSAQTHRSADCTSQQNCTVPGRSDPRPNAAAAAAARDHGAVGRGSEGGHSTRRWRRPGRWRVTMAVRMSSAGPATAGSGRRDPDPDPEPVAVQILDAGPKTSWGAHRASSRRTRQVDARRATVSASAFASATPSALRAVLSCAAGSKTLAAIASSPRGCRGSGGSLLGRCLPARLLVVYC